ncbi:MAG: hypothetical protein OEU54_12655 [Gemmatimonadota bacterium]|nr:hypothetical protein [Gemmatimonadota bacterium]
MTDANDRDDGRVQRIADLSMEPPAGFHRRVRRGVNRRVLAGDLTHFSLAGLAHAFLEYLTALFGFAASARASGAPPSDEVDTDE